MGHNVSVEQQQQLLWDQFLALWPIERVRKMTLEEYSQAGNKDNFTYWLERETKPIANILGGSAFKFGIYHRSAIEDKQDGKGKIYQDGYAWLEKYGTTKEQAFAEIKRRIIETVEYAQAGNLEAIDALDFSPVIKWKIAFLYQNQLQPKIISIFSKTMLDYLTEDKKLNYAEAYQHLINAQEERSLLEYGNELVQEYIDANPKQTYLTPTEADEILNAKYPEQYISRQKMTVVTNDAGREIALVLTGSKASFFIEVDPANSMDFKFQFKSTREVPNGKYTEHDGRHSGLKSQSKNLWLGNKIYFIEIDSAQELDKFCDWYEQEIDQSHATALEHKVKEFLKLWPIDRLKGLTLESYHQAKNKECFITQIDSFDPTQGDPTFACYFDIWEPIGLGDNDKYHNQKPYSWNKRLGDNEEQAFDKLKQEILDIVDASQRRDLKAIDQIQFTKGLKWMIAFLYQDFNDPFIIPIVSRVNTKRIGYDHLYPKLPLPEFLPVLLADKGEQQFFPYVEKLFAMVRKGYLDNKQQKQQTEELVDEVMTQQPLNRILFGAAGTGKTFHTINHALSIIENKTLESLEDEDRTALKKRFDEYKDQGQIKFVTFHQSFSYEDFVEGIRAETDDGKLTYDVKQGVFKEICDLARATSKIKVNEFKETIEFGRGYKLLNITTELLEIQKPNGNIFHLSRMLGDYLLHAYKNNKITIQNIIDKEVVDILGSQPILEPYLVHGYNTVLANLIPVLDSVLLKECDKTKSKAPYVLIIDEINRGNISRIFGELITLIEDSKRAGADEALSVTLPYSKEEFSVPKNVYLIGTMNSSDRSLTGLDVALRRRFTFVEMPPNHELLSDIEIDGLNIGELLKVMNQRIEVLLDRDHCIGHANFMTLNSESTVEDLAQIFSQKIIPQLQEYFFDDWAKINLVLFNNGMLQSKSIQNGLFPNNSEEELSYLEQKKIWSVNPKVFNNIETYRAILGAGGTSNG